MKSSWRNKSYRFRTAVGLACVCFLFVTGAFWHKEKKETPKTTEAKNKTQGAATDVKTEPLLPSAIPSVQIPPTKAAGLPQTNPPAASVSAAVPQPAKVIKPPALKPEAQQVQIDQVRKELADIIERTRTLEKQAQVDRAKVEQILIQARIHEQILQKLQPPAPVKTADQVNLSKILEQEKLKLIAGRAEQNREELAKLERGREKISTVPLKPASVKKS